MWHFARTITDADQLCAVPILCAFGWGVDHYHSEFGIHSDLIDIGRDASRDHVAKMENH